MRVEVHEREHGRHPSTIFVDGVLDGVSGGVAGPDGVVAVLDGAGDWGAGDEVAGWVRERLEGAWSLRPPSSLDEVEQSLERTVAAVPEELVGQDEPFGGFAFSLVVVAWSGGQCNVLAAGDLGVYDVSGPKWVEMFKPRLLVDDWTEQHHPSQEELDAFPHKNVCTGPFVSDKGCPVRRLPPRCVLPGSRIVAAPEVLCRAVAQSRCDVCAGAQALHDAAVTAGLPHASCGPIVILTS